MKRTGVAYVAFRNDWVVPGEHAPVGSLIKLKRFRCLHWLRNERLTYQPRNDCVRKGRYVTGRDQAGGVHRYQVGDDQFAFEFEQFLFVKLHHVHSPEAERFVDGVNGQGLQQKDRRDASFFLRKQVHLDRPSREGGEHFLKPYGR